MKELSPAPQLSQVSKPSQAPTQVTAPDAPADCGLWLEAAAGFVSTPAIEQVVRRARAYLDAGYPVHFSGPAGIGKTTLAFHVAALRQRPVVLIHGDESLKSSDLVGGESGYRRSRVVDNYVHSVLKTEENVQTLWADNRLTLACKQGYTLLYDEFTRSRAEANNALLSVLEERLLTMPRQGTGEEACIGVHPEFRAIVTSNPEEYAGVHRTQDALADRLVTIRLDHFDRETEVVVTQAKSGLSREDCEVVVDIVRGMRKLGIARHGPSVRAAIMIARMAAQEKVGVGVGDPLFDEVCQDVLSNVSGKVFRDGEPDVSHRVAEVIAAHSIKATLARPRREQGTRA
jgi:gas vesicle protein GvpN